MTIGGRAMIDQRSALSTSYPIYVLVRPGRQLFAVSSATFLLIAKLRFVKKSTFQCFHAIPVIAILIHVNSLTMHLNGLCHMPVSITCF